MMLALVAVTVALSALPQAEVLDVPPGSFVLGPGTSKVAVTAVGVPRGIGILPEYRTCRVHLTWNAGKATSAFSVVGDCHPNLVDEVESALERWKVEVTAPPVSDRILMEAWYVFPEVRGNPVRLFVRQAWDSTLTVRAPEIDVLGWGLKSRVPLEYPPEANETDTQSTTCEVRLDIASSGTPGNLGPTGCDAVFAPAVQQGLERWRFQTEELDGIPTWSGVTLAVRFTRNFEKEGPPGTAIVLFPPDPDLGDRTIARVEDLPVEREPRPDPAWPARFVVDHLSFAQVAVYDWRFPEVPPSPEERTCDVLFGVNSRRVLWAWTETCDPSVRAATEQAANLWILKPARIDRGEIYARFRATYVFPPDGAPALVRIPRGDLVTAESQLPDRFETYANAQAIRRVPPRLPRAFATEVLEEVVVCDLVADVATNGNPREITVETCPSSYTPFAVDAVSHWRWTPAEVDGKAIRSRERVRVRFNLPGSAPAEGT